MSEDFRNRSLRYIDFSGATFRDVDFSGVKMIEANLVDADLSGLIIGLRINGVEVAPLISAELDRLHPERVLLRAEDPDGVRRAWGLIEEMWRPTMARAANITEEARQRRIDDEWSFVETLRHLIFVTDGWFSRTVLGEAHPYHPFGLPPTFIRDLRGIGIDPDAKPSFADVAVVREQRMAVIRDALARITAAGLERRCAHNETPGYPPETEHSVLSCLHTIIDEEWDHHQYAIRDLARVEAEG